MVGEAQDTPAIQVQGLHKSYGDWPVLWDLSLTVGWGEFLALFGANGVGKTTLLRVLSTQARPDAGTVLVAGHDRLRRPQAVRRCIGVVGHSSFLYDDMTCRENLMFYGRLFGVKDLPRRIHTVLDRLDLGRRADDRVRTLSHGMQKRAAIARAILHQPAVLLMDEPEAGLDRESVATLKGLLAEWTASGRAVVMATHNVDLGRAWANRVAVLSGGRLRDRPPDQNGAAGPLEEGAGPFQEADRR